MILLVTNSPQLANPPPRMDRIVSQDDIQNYVTYGFNAALARLDSDEGLALPDGGVLRLYRVDRAVNTQAAEAPRTMTEGDL